MAKFPLWGHAKNMKPIPKRKKRNERQNLRDSFFV